MIGCLAVCYHMINVIWTKNTLDLCISRSIRQLEIDTGKPKKNGSNNHTMPIKMGKKKYKSFDIAAAAVAKKKWISKERAKAYVAVVDRKQHKKKKWAFRTLVYFTSVNRADR